MAKSFMVSDDASLASEAHGWDPNEVSRNSDKRCEWICSRGHVWGASPKSRLQNRDCPVCTGRLVVVGVNDLATTHPELAGEIAIGDPTSVTSRKSVKFRWRCKEGHEWDAVVYGRASGSGCPTCAGKTVLAGFNDFASAQPDLALEAYGWDPATVTAGSHKKCEWLCPDGHIYDATVPHRIEGKGCPYCAGKRVLPGFNDLATTEPELAKWADGWNPTEVSRGSGKYLGWRCELGHTWKARIPDRRAGNGCPYCSGKKVLWGSNDLATIDPELAAQADGWDPKTVTKGSNPKRSWKCSLGHSWLASVNQRYRVRTGCPYCAGKLALQGFNDLATTDPELSAQVIEGDPTKVTSNSSRQFRWRCEFGHEWKTSVDHRSRGRSCPVCAKTGYDPNKDGYLYFLCHDAWGLFQIGITNNLKQRVSKHLNRGWRLMESPRGPYPGEVARSWEISILKMLRGHGANVGSAEIAGKFDGYTESWTMRSFETPKTMIDLMTLVHVDEELALTNDL